MTKQRFISIICLSLVNVIIADIVYNRSKVSSIVILSPEEGTYELKLSKENTDSTHFQVLYYQDGRWNVYQEYDPSEAGTYTIQILDLDYLIVQIADENDDSIWTCSLEGIKEDTNALGYTYRLPDSRDLVEGCYEILYSSVSSSVHRLYQTDKTYFDPYENITDGVAVIIWG